MNIFHFVIIAYLFFIACGCGYKASPYYSNAVESRENFMLDSALDSNANFANTKKDSAKKDSAEIINI